MSKLACVISTIAFAAATSTATAGGTGWGCRTCGYSNGAEATGVALRGAAETVAAIVLPSGETIDLRSRSR
jgi:hypothetical protein